MPLDELFAGFHEIAHQGNTHSDSRSRSVDRDDNGQREIAQLAQEGMVQRIESRPDGGRDVACAFDRAFGRLSIDDRAILVLHHLQERPVAEIAATFGAPVGTIKARLFRARAALESALAKESR